MVKKICLCCLMFLLLFIVTACTQEYEEAVPVSIHVDFDTVPKRIEVDALAWETIILIVTMSDGTYTTVTLDETMIDDNDKAKVMEVGEHEIIVRYKGLTTLMTLVITKDDFFTQLMAIYQLGLESGLIDGTYEEWLESIRGEDGREIVFNTTDTHIQWKYEGEIVWKDLIAFDVLMGDCVVDGMSAYDIYKTYHPGYVGSELDWLEQLIDGSLPFAPAETIPFTFDVIEDTHAIITSYTGVETKMNVPMHIAGYEVTAIDAFAFSGVEHVEHIVIPSSITTIGMGAFEAMTALKKLHIPDSVETVGEGIVSGSDALEIFSEHTAQPDGWHPEWNLAGYPVAWFLELDYHGLYSNLFSAQVFKFQNYGIEDGVVFESTFQVFHNAYFFDYLPPNYLSPTERVSWYCVIRTPETFESPPYYDRYDYDVENACYSEKSHVDAGVFAGYADYFMQIREMFYVSTLQDEWFKRTVTGFALKEAYLDAIPDVYIAGEINAFEIHFVDDGFGLYIHALFPGHTEPAKGWFIYTDIDVSVDLPDFVPCEP